MPRVPVRPCSVAMTETCEAPANGSRSTRLTCFACGEPVCHKCSEVLRWTDGKLHRVGHDCMALTW